MCMQSLLDDSLAEIQRYRTYGGWSVQRPEYGTLGRFDPAMTWLLPDGRTFALTLRLDRAAYQLYREAEVPHDQALHNSLLCGSWAGLHNAPGLGTWEMELRAPASDRVELVAMLWPEDDQEWPLGEINFVEGRVGTGSTMTNLHWPDPATGQPAHHRRDAVAPLPHRDHHHRGAVAGRWKAAPRARHRPCPARRTHALRRPVRSQPRDP